MILIQRRNIYYYMTALILIASENFFYLLDYTTLKNVFVIITLLWAIYVMHILQPLPSPKYRYGVVVMFAVVLVVTSSLQSYIRYGQPITLGIRPQRYWITWALMYFPLRKLMYNDILTKEDLWDIIEKVCVIEFVLYTIQFVAGENFELLHVTSNNEYATTRYYVSYVLILLFAFKCLSDIFEKKSVLKNIIYIVMSYFIVLGIGKLRMVFLAMTGAIIIGILLWRNGGRYKFVIIVTVFIAVAILGQLEIVQSIFDSLNGSATRDSLSIRTTGRAFYIEELLNHPLLGGGYINTQWNASYLASRYGEGIYWVDNGIFGFIYLFGGVGLAWAVILFLKMVLNGNQIRVLNNRYEYLMMPLYWIISCITDASWMNITFFVLTLTICLQENMLDEDENEGSEMDHVEGSS